MFKDQFTLTDPVSGSSVPALGTVASLPDIPEVGTYNYGLVAVVDADASTTLLDSWKSLVGDSAIALITSGLGDVFFWKKDESAVYFLNVQRGTTELIDHDLHWFLNEFLTKEGVIEEVLRKTLFDSLVKHHRALRFHETFILEPWQMLGGEEKVENFTIGECSVYLDLVGQSHQS